MLTKRIALLGAVAALMSAGAPAALAQTSSQEGYDGEAPVGQVQGIAPQQAGGNGDVGSPASTVTGGVASQTASSDSGALPFTGWDAGIVLALGLALAGTGLAVRRATRSTAN